MSEGWYGGWVSEGWYGGWVSEEWYGRLRCLL